MIARIWARLPRPVIHSLYVFVGALATWGVDALAPVSTSKPVLVLAVAAAGALLRAVETAVKTPPAAE